MEAHHPERIKFGTDGVREIVGRWPINMFGAQKIGFGIATYLNNNVERPRVLVGRDTRISGDMLSAALASGLLGGGVDVVDVGVITTAGTAFLSKKHQFKLGIMISASHNPWIENGIKLIGSDGHKLEDRIEAALEAHINDLRVDNEVSDKLGQRLDKAELVNDYVCFLVSPFNSNSPTRLRVVLDCANGAASQIAPKCFELLNCQTIVINNHPSGTNINVNSGSEVARESRGDLSSTVVANAAHFGVAFDGDADRAIFVDEHGKLVDGDHVLYILAAYLNKRGMLPKHTVVTTEMANGGLDAALSRIGIEIIRTRVGDKYVVRTLKDVGAGLGGEQSGHIVIYDDWHTTGDGIYTALYLASILAQNPSLSLATLAADLQKLPQVIASARVTQKPALDSLHTFIAERQQILRELGSGAKVNARYSGTEPLFRVMIEGNVNHSVAEIAQQSVRLCQTLQNAINDKGQPIEVKDCTSGTAIDIINHVYD